MLKHHTVSVGFACVYCTRWKLLNGAEISSLQGVPVGQGGQASLLHATQRCYPHAEQGTGILLQRQHATMITKWAHMQIESRQQVTTI